MLFLHHLWDSLVDDHVYFLLFRPRMRAVRLDDLWTTIILRAVFLVHNKGAPLNRFIFYSSSLVSGVLVVELLSLLAIFNLMMLRVV
jgi:hypothetical protein